MAWACPPAAALPPAPSAGSTAAGKLTQHLDGDKRIREVDRQRLLRGILNVDCPAERILGDDLHIQRPIRDAVEQADMRSGRIQRQLA